MVSRRFDTFSCFKFCSFLQLESGFLSNEESKARLPNIMKDILTNLNLNGVCTVPIGKILNANRFGTLSKFLVPFFFLFAPSFSYHSFLISSPFTFVLL